MALFTSGAQTDFSTRSSKGRLFAGNLFGGIWSLVIPGEVEEPLEAK
jgi:hypothetical protein